MKQKGDYSKGSILNHLIRLALPVFLAELVHVLYSLVDRMFIGHIEGVGTYALSGIGVVFPVISFINAFAGLCSSGGAPLCSIARGKGDDELAETILETSFTLLIVFGVLLTFSLFVFIDPLLMLVGATEDTLVYAKEYFSVYLVGTTFALISLGINPFINMQGNSVIGMWTVLIGAILNIILDPIFIFALDMGLKGAAIATVISQFFSMLWAMKFLLSPKAAVRIRRLSLDLPIVMKIFRLGATGFMFKITNSLTQAVANIALNIFGGANAAIYIGATSIINSIREVLGLPTSSISNSGQPIEGYNYGARKYKRVAKTIDSVLAINLTYTLIAWSLLQLFPSSVISIFTPDITLIETTVPCLRLYFGAFFMMSLQMVGQNTFVALNCPKRAMFFSLFRKAVLVVPLTFILPKAGFGVHGVFLAEMISQVIGAALCFACMRVTIYRKVIKAEDGEALTV